jgi:hypothetical protein
MLKQTTLYVWQVRRMGWMEQPTMDPARGPGSPHDQGSGLQETMNWTRQTDREEQAGRLHDH